MAVPIIAMYFLGGGGWGLGCDERSRTPQPSLLCTTVQSRNVRSITKCGGNGSYKTVFVKDLGAYSGSNLVVVMYTGGVPDIKPQVQYKLTFKTNRDCDGYVAVGLSCVS